MKFAYVDVNCRLKIRSADDQEYMFENMEELNEILGIRPDYEVKADET